MKNRGLFILVFALISVLAVVVARSDDALTRLSGVLLHFSDGSGTGVTVSDSSPFPMQEYWVTYAEQEILETYGDTVSVADKRKSLNKFGLTTNADTDTATTIMTLPGATQRHETYLSANSIDTISSSNGSDTSIPMVVEGHTVSGTDLTFVVQSATLLGTSKVTLTTPLCRVTRAYRANGTAALTEGTRLQGAVYVYEDDDTTTPGVPDTDTKVHLVIPAGYQQSEKCATALSSTDYWLIRKVGAAVSRGNTANVEIELQIREPGGVFRPRGRIIEIRSTSTVGKDVIYEPYLIVPPNSDVRLVATSSAGDTTVYGEIQGILASVVNNN